jgi:type IV pilus assembly protein PilA
MFTRTRLGGRSEAGFTVIELLVVIIIIGMLLAIAVPSYLGFRDRAANNAAKTNLRAALPAAEAYYADNSTYVGMDDASLLEIDSTLSSTLSVTKSTTNSFCLAENVNGKTWSVLGPNPASSTGFVPNSDCSGAS